MQFLRCAVAITALAACAEAQTGKKALQPDAPRGSRDAGADSSTSDGPPADAPPSGSCTTPFSGILGTWDFSTQSGSESMVTASSSASGVVAGSFTRAAALTAASGSGSINSSNWPSAAQRDSTKYYSVSVAPPSGCSLSIASISIDAKSSATGPASAVVATSVDSFSLTGAVSTSAPSTPALAVTNAAGSVEIRIYGYSASSSSGTLRVQNTFTVTGSLQ